MTKKHIIFDFDDTIASSHDLNKKLFIETILRYKSDADQTYLEKIHDSSMGTSMVSQFREITQELKISVEPEKLVQENEHLQQRRALGIEIFDGLEEMLAYLKKLNKMLSVISNRPGKSLRTILKKHDLIHYFDNIVSCADMGKEKPDPYCLVKLLQKYPGISKEESIYFGDSKTDEEFAAKAGIDFLVVNYYSNQRLFYKMVLETFTIS